MELYNLSPAAGSTKEAFRKGRGHGSDNGKTGTYYRIERVDALLKPLLGGAGASNFAVVHG